MDPVSQAVVGATLTQSLARNNITHTLACIIGVFAGIAADIDVLFHSSSDPLLFLEYHRQFTHSLVFIPLGGFICATILFFLLRRKTRFNILWLYASLGYGTHGLLDACTSYGTQLFWPFSNARIAWDIIAIIDPLFTVPILLLILIGVNRKSTLYPRLAIAWIAVYFSLGVLQHQRADAALMDIADARGHTVERKTVKPTFGNLVLWKLIYQYNGIFYVDAVRLLDDIETYTGENIAAFKHGTYPPVSDIQSKDIERFRWFSDGYIAASPTDPLRIGDIRYSVLPNKIDPLWSIQLLPNSPKAHVDYVISRDLRASKREEFFSMLLRGDKIKRNNYDDFRFN